MRSLLVLLPAVLLAQTPAPVPKAPAKAATGTAAPKAAGTAAPSGTARPGAGRGVTTTPKPAAPPPLTTDEQKTIYAVGLSIARQLASLDLSPAELELVKRALSDAAAKKPAVPIEEWGPKIQGLATARAARAAEKE